MPSLRGPAEILLDPWGVPHIYASCPEDAFFTQGFNAARDRLWQLDLWRRQGLGLLSEVLGPGYVARDRAARLFLYRGSMEHEWAAYGCDHPVASSIHPSKDTAAGRGCRGSKRPVLPPKRLQDAPVAYRGAVTIG